MARPARARPRQPHRLQAEQALALHRELGDAWGIAYAELQFAQVFTEEDDFAAATPLCEESVRRLREVGDEHRALQATRLVAWCYLELGDVERAKTHYEDLLRGARAARDKQMEARALATLAQFATDEGRHLDALAMLEEAYRLDCEFGDPHEIAMDLIWFARALAFAGRAGTAARLLSRSEATHEELGMTYPAWVAARKEEAMSRAQAQLEQVAFAEAWEQGRALTVDEAVSLALTALE
jgi:tetratricopeptide (TPR) repeat protein